MRRITSLTMLGCVIGLAIGLAFAACNASEAAVKLVRFPGTLWVRALKLMVVPMIFTSMIVSVAAAGSSEGKETARMARLAVQYYLTTTLVAALEGIILFNLFSGTFAPLAPPSPNSTSELGDGGTSALPPGSTALDAIVDFGFALVPDNLVQVFLETQLLGVITVAAFLGACLPSAPHGHAVLDMARGLFEIFVEMIRRCILATPLGVCSLVAGSIAAAEDVVVVFSSLAALLGAITIGHACHAFVFYPLIYLVAVRRNPIRYFAGLPRVWITAFGTSSSAATLSTTIDVCTRTLGVSDAVARFVLPIGCTLNMDGGALERPIVVLWIAHVSGQPVTASTMLLAAVTSALLSIGASPIPSAGVSTLVVMVEQVGVPFTPTVMLAISFCLAVEWLLDSMRTTVNVTGDAIGVAIVDSLLEQHATRRSPRTPRASTSADAGVGAPDDLQGAHTGPQPCPQLPARGGKRTTEFTPPLATTEPGDAACLEVEVEGV